MRLIDADKLRLSAIEITHNSEFAFDNCFPYWQFSKAIKEAPIVETIPVEWIRSWGKKCACNAVKIMLNDWEKENEDENDRQSYWDAYDRKEDDEEIFDSRRRPR